MTIHQFPDKSDKAERIIQCGCGSTTFRVILNGEIECASCESRLVNDLTAIPFDDIKIAPAKFADDTVDCGTADLAFKRTIDKARYGETAGLVVMNFDGVTSTWFIFEGSDRERAWFQERVDGLMATL